MSRNEECNSHWMTDDTQENCKVNWGHEAEAANDGERAPLDGLSGGSQRDTQSVIMSPS